jgi:vesicle coat complex subunit
MTSAQKWKNKSSELDDLKKDLTEKKVEKRIEAVKKIIGNLNVGKDVSSLFFPVLKCLDSDSIELRKLVYLYIIHYSKDKPDDSIMAINQLVKVDSLLRRMPLTNPTRSCEPWPSEPWAA